MSVPISNNFATLLQKKQDEEKRFIPLSEVAHATGIPRKTLYQWDKNIVTRFDTRIVDKLCKYFSVSLPELLNHTLPDEVPAKKKK